MEPTLEPGDWLLVDPDAYGRRAPAPASWSWRPTRVEPERLLDQARGSRDRPGRPAPAGWRCARRVHRLPDLRSRRPERSSLGRRGSGTGRLGAVRPGRADARCVSADQLAHQRDVLEVARQEVLEHQPLDRRQPRTPPAGPCLRPGCPSTQRSRVRSSHASAVGRRRRRTSRSGRRPARASSASSRPTSAPAIDRPRDRGRVAPPPRACLVQALDGPPNRVGAGRAQVVLVGVARRQAQCDRGLPVPPTMIGGRLARRGRNSDPRTCQCSPSKVQPSGSSHRPRRMRQLLLQSCRPAPCRRVRDAQLPRAPARSSPRRRRPRPGRRSSRPRSSRPWRTLPGTPERHRRHERPQPDALGLPGQAGERAQASVVRRPPRPGKLV